MKKIAVVAIGGNSLIKEGGGISFADQLNTVYETCENLVAIIENGYELLITHGNGPQVGYLLLKNHLARNFLPEEPLDSANAMTQGEIGYMITLAMSNVLKRKKINKEVVTLITRVLVDENDEDFKKPSKPIGPFYTREEMENLKKRYGWIFVEDAYRGFRRVVPSPKPKKVLEINAIKNLLEDGKIVIAGGGGGIGVIEKNGDYLGIACVIDKDLTASLMAKELNAQLFIISTAVPYVYLNYGKKNKKPLRKVNLSEIIKYHEEGHFPKGNMGPKIEAAIEFLKNGGKEVIITSPENIERALEKKAGTRIIK